MKLIHFLDIFPQGPYFQGQGLCMVDVCFAPFALRLSRILEPARRWDSQGQHPRLTRWIVALEGNPYVKKTTSAKPLISRTRDLLMNYHLGKLGV